MLRTPHRIITRMDAPLRVWGPGCSLCSPGGAPHLLHPSSSLPLTELSSRPPAASAAPLEEMKVQCPEGQTSSCSCRTSCGRTGLGRETRVGRERRTLMPSSGAGCGSSRRSARRPSAAPRALRSRPGARTTASRYGIMPGASIRTAPPSTGSSPQPATKCLPAARPICSRASSTGAPTDSIARRETPASTGSASPAGSTVPESTPRSRRGRQGCPSPT